MTCNQEPPLFLPSLARMLSEVWRLLCMAMRGKHEPAAAHTCEVYALVEATPISQPALMCTPQCVERAMAEPTVLVTPMQSAPRALAYSSACMPVTLQELGESRLVTKKRGI